MDEDYRLRRKDYELQNKGLTDFRITSEFTPTGDQPQAIKELIEGLNREDKFQTLLGVTGSGKTFTIANVIQECKKTNPGAES